MVPAEVSSFVNGKRMFRWVSNVVDFQVRVGEDRDVLGSRFLGVYSLFL